MLFNNNIAKFLNRIALIVDRNRQCTIGGHKKLGQTSNLYKVKNQKYTSCKFDFL
jgi:hypothetical protein